MNDKIKKASTLFIALGTVDDALISAAMTAPKARRFTPWRIAAISVAAVLLLTFSFYSVASLSRFFNYMNMSGEEKAHSRLMETLSDAAESNSIPKVKAEDLDLFSGKTQIIWREQGEEYYSTVSVKSESDKELIRRGVKEPASEVSPDKRAAGTLVWISYGDGTVLSPYLVYSSGNVGYGELFDYSAEVYPNESLSELVKDLVSEQA